MIVEIKKGVLPYLTSLAKNVLSMQSFYFLAIKIGQYINDLFKSSKGFSSLSALWFP